MANLHPDARTYANPPRCGCVRRLWALALACCLAPIHTAIAANAVDPPPRAVLHLANDSFLPGDLLGTDDPKVLRFACPYFTKPFEFPLKAVNVVHYPVPATPPKSTDEYGFELDGGDVLFGNLLGMNEDSVALDSARLGRIHVQRDHIRRFYRCRPGESIYQGPNGLAAWTDASATPQWRDEGGQLVTDRPNAVLSANLGIPAKAIVEFELSWKRKPDFMFAFGVDKEDRAAPGIFQVEVWDNDLVLVGESKQDADVASLQTLAPREGRVRLQAYLDQEQSRLIVLSAGGKQLATMKLTVKKPHVFAGVRVTNKKGDVRLEQLRITRWNGLPPRDARENQSRLQRADGSVVYCRVTAFDPKTKQFTIRDGNNETRLDQAAIADVFLKPPADDAQGTAPAGNDAAEHNLCVVYHDGTRLSGHLARVEATHVSLRSGAIREPLRLPLAELHSLIGLRQGEAAGMSPGAGRSARLETDGLRLHGRLVDGTEQSGGSCLVWQPDQCRTASPLCLGMSGRIVYREPPPPPPPSGTPSRRRPPPPPPRGLGQIILGLLGSDAPSRPSPGGHRSLYLRSGDTIPCEVGQIDDKGVHFKTPLSDATFVAHDKIKAIELMATRDPPRLAKTKRERLLTLPRMQRDTPPTHLVRSKTGDFLRGRLVEMDEARLTFEVRLENKAIPRDRVAQIIWLHGDELAPPKSAAAAKHHPPSRTRVQTVRPGGSRLTFVAKSFQDTMLTGVSEVLGACHANVGDIDELLFGDVIEESAAKLAYQRWKLHYATEPLFAQDKDGSAAGRLAVAESPLLGQTAFPFKLDMLDGRKFQLADCKGRVVVVDFWATWCGPCLQTMPIVDGVVREFADRKVELIAVNMEEEPDQIKSMMERHKLKVPVALDREGVVAAKYAVTAIPQTVVIDRDGKVARLFVGGGPPMAEALRKALQDVLAGKPATPTTPAVPAAPAAQQP